MKLTHWIQWRGLASNELSIKLAVDPLMLGNQIKRLKGDAAMRLRVGGWRVIFDLRRDETVVLAVAHRREVYRSET